MPRPELPGGARRIAAALACGAAFTAAADPGPPPATPGSTHEVLVIGTAEAAEPPGADDLAAGLDQLTAGELATLHVHGLGDAVARLGGVSLSDTQGSPLQPDLSLRGFTASPVLGTPQGLAVYVDGVRVNESFGDTVNWDLIPAGAIASLERVPGSDPSAGLDSLGGAIAIRTLRGSDAPGTRLSAEGGSFGRRGVGAASGAAAGGVDWFASGTLYDDPGWAAHARSLLRQAFAELGYRGPRTDLRLTLTLADNRLEGNQTLPRSWLGDPAAAYTWPDTTGNRLLFVEASARRALAAGWELGGRGWYRQLASASANSNVNAGFDPSRPPGADNPPTDNALASIGEYQSGATISIAGPVRIARLAQSLRIGLSFARADSSFLGLEQPAGAGRDTTSNAPAEPTTSLAATSATAALDAADVIALTARLSLALGVRQAVARQQLRDRLGTALTGDHRFPSTRRSVRLDFRPTPLSELYASASEGLRIPTAIELACAAPSAPCSLPNAFAADPALAAVRSSTTEAGARVRLAPGATLELEVYRTRLADDIAFVSAGGGTNAGYFRTIGASRREGAGLGVAVRRGALELYARGDWLAARYAAPLTLPSPWNSSASPLSCPSCADIAVPAGAVIPGQPARLLKLRVGWSSGASAVGLALAAQSSQYARGDDNNRDRNGPLPGFAVLAADARFELGLRWQAWARIDNLLDHRYSTFAVLGRNVFTAAGERFDASGAGWRAEQFRSLAAPRTLALGVEWHLGPTHR